MQRWWKTIVLGLVIIGLMFASYPAAAAEKITDPRELCKTWHTVVRGEDLSQIAAKYNMNVLVLMALNPLPNPDIIYPGQELCVALKVRAGRMYMVSDGDNLTRIAARYGANVAYLIEVNGLSTPDTLFVGQVLYIPKGRIMQVAR